MEKSGDSRGEETGRVSAVCVSEEKGTRKKPVTSITLRPGYGVVGDAHGGSERQISLLCQESIDKMRAQGLPTVGSGDFAENITISGLRLNQLQVGAILRIGGNVVLRLTQIGKECHSECEIRRISGNCIMPREGVFAEVLQGGEARAGDKVRVEELS
ncbi:MAG: MOSC domain-containing protein [Armatimonadetes bacterium]|nr:MOSC domain-containing protein [Armatimonadota bacterium]NIM24290.1 MOSC domain-containing protein [Armatimonadota bacterium]NIM68159.1 MOSC domain-containing protein [Armatimonadota bacterium]NIM76619.1 MOSC domain-containing protein [Armatimonadota bacterium]NIN06364.1 MOSC domain-containing protein [Armatimonadota bacterium]